MQKHMQSKGLRSRPALAPTALRPWGGTEPLWVLASSSVNRNSDGTYLTALFQAWDEVMGLMLYVTHKQCLQSK